MKSNKWQFFFFGIISALAIMLLIIVTAFILAKYLVKEDMPTEASLIIKPTTIVLHPTIIPSVTIINTEVPLDDMLAWTKQILNRFNDFTDYLVDLDKTIEYILVNPWILDSEDMKQKLVIQLSLTTQAAYKLTYSECPDKEIQEYLNSIHNVLKEMRSKILKAIETNENDVIILEIERIEEINELLDNVTFRLGNYTE